MSKTPTPKHTDRYKARVPNFGKILESEYPPVKSKTPTQNDCAKKARDYVLSKSESGAYDLTEDIETEILELTRLLADATKEGYKQGKLDQIRGSFPFILDNEWVVTTIMTNGKKILSHRLIITDRMLDQSRYILENMCRDLSYEFEKYLATLKEEQK